MHPFEAKQPERLAMHLGYAGLIPFVSGALGVWVAPSGWRPFVMTALLDYAAVILAFMGAIHWGLAMRAQASDERAKLQLGLSVIPALLGWVAIASGMSLDWLYRSSFSPSCCSTSPTCVRPSWAWRRNGIRRCAGP